MVALDRDFNRPDKQLRLVWGTRLIATWIVLRRIEARREAVEMLRS